MKTFEKLVTFGAGFVCAGALAVLHVRESINYPKQDKKLDLSDFEDAVEVGGDAHWIMNDGRRAVLAAVIKREDC